ncbi:transaldolase family protein [Erysipelothrix urinaevulpis]|uniref:transaldolase family protein n=1 Tax=Erysipelothrix urinaevulpis TaxID=2683717 RepID=UPI0019155BEB|nr:transaldolase family protein [Erysipelothrix urinaevulpis]
MYKSPLHETAVKYGTDFWNDSCSISELEYAIEYGAVGATTNPVIVKNVIEAEFDTYQPIIQEMVAKYPNETEDEIAWRIIEMTAIEGAKLLEPIFKETNGQKGRISIQTNTKYYRSAEKMADQAEYFSTLAPNMQVKMPSTKEGIEAFEEATYRGVSINATVSFSVAQAVAVAEAVERGLKRREEEGLDSSTMHPVCTIMVGRVGDWTKEAAETQGINLSPEALELAGVSVMKNAYTIFQEKGYRTTLLAAAYRFDNQWLDFVGGNLEMTIPHKWIKKFNEGDYKVESRIDVPVDQAIIDELLHVDDFKKMYLAEGMKPEDFVHLGATQKTLTQFFGGYDELLVIIRKEQLKQ